MRQHHLPAPLIIVKLTINVLTSTVLNTRLFRSRINDEYFAASISCGALGDLFCPLNAAAGSSPAHAIDKTESPSLPSLLAVS